MQRSSFNVQESGDTAIPNIPEPSGQKAPISTTPKRRMYRVKEIAGPNGMFPISVSSWWAGVRLGIYPRAIKLSARCTVWRAEDLEQLAQHGIDGATFSSSPTSSSEGQS